MKTLIAFFLLGAANALFAQTAVKTALKVHGSTTVEGALEPKHKELEVEIGRKIAFTANGSTSGLADLAAGRADVAMISSPFDEIAQKVNHKFPGSVKTGEYHVAQVGHARITFIVHPKNPLKKMNAEQIRDALTGKAKNWKELGGEDAPIIVVSLANGGSLVQEELLNGTPITKDCRALVNANQIPVVVGQEPNAIGIISTAHMKGKTTLVDTDAKVFAPLFLVTKGEPDPAVRKMIETCQVLLGETDAGRHAQAR